MKRLHVFLIFAIVGIAVYANSFQNDFVWDDEYLITNNTHVQEPSIKHALLLFKDNLGKYGQDENNFYRPLQELSYMVDYAIWELDPAGFHLTNLLLHLLVVFILFLIVEHVSGNQAIALISSLIYLVHPLHIEAVTYIAGRADSLMALFFLLSFYLYMRRESVNHGIKKSRLYLLSSLSFIWALLSKEIAIMLPVVLIFYDWAFRSREEKRGALRHLHYLAIAAIYAILRATVLNFKHPVTVIPEGVGFYERLLTSFRVFKEYFKLIILPFDLHMERVLVYSKSLLQGEVFLSGMILAGVIIVMVLLRKRHRLVFFGIGWFFVTIFPLSNLPFALNATMAEHWLYIPLMGIAMVGGYVLVRGAGSILNKGTLSKIVIAGLSICIVVYFSILTVSQNTKWRDGETLYKYTLKYAEDSSRLHYNLGNTHRETGRLAEAEREYRISIELDPVFHSAHFNLGLTYAKMGDADRAISEFRESIELKPGHYKSYNALGLAYKDKGMFDEAMRCYNKTSELNPDYADAYNNLGDAYFNKEMYKEAEEKFRKALAIDLDYTKAWNNLGVSLIMQGRIEEAVAAWNKSLQINPDQPIIKDYIRRNVD